MTYIDDGHEIVKHITALGERSHSGYRLELNIVRWGGVEKYDIRSWDRSHRWMTRGMTFTRDEIMIIAEAMKGEVE